VRPFLTSRVVFTEPKRDGLVPIANTTNSPGLDGASKENLACAFSAPGSFSTTLVPKKATFESPGLNGVGNLPSKVGGGGGGGAAVLPSMYVLADLNIGMLLVILPKIEPPYDPTRALVLELR